MSPDTFDRALSAAVRLPIERNVRAPSPISDAAIAMVTISSISVKPLWRLFALTVRGIASDLRPCGARAPARLTTNCSHAVLDVVLGAGDAVGPHAEELEAVRADVL